MKTLVFCLLFVGAFAAPSGKPKFRPGLNKIVGGTDVVAGQLPYQLSFQVNYFTEAFHFCGASIYNENWAISAGHCVDRRMDDPTVLQVVAGEINKYVEEGNEQIRALSSIVLHEDFNRGSLSNDISLLKLSEPLTFNDYVQPIALPAQGHSATGDCIVSGWGTTSEGGGTPSVLQEVSVTIVPDGLCSDLNGGIEESMICAGVPGGGKDSCQGDSGGPLACSDTGSTYLAGIVSWGWGCGRPNNPGVYCEVAYYVDWIKRHTE